MNKITRIILLIPFLVNILSLPHLGAQAIDLVQLPVPGAMINLSPAFSPVMIKGLMIHKNNPLLFDFIVDVGQEKLSPDTLKKEGEKLIKYFLASLAVPEKDLWVNLSPYEKDRTIPEELSKTDMGRDLLAEDYILKQVTSSLLFPEKNIGRIFWNKIYSAASLRYGTTQIPIHTFNKVWIMADKAEVFQHNQTAFITGSHLKVMLEEDFLALTKRAVASHKAHTLASNVVRQLILPELENEVNHGRNFASLRQIFNSLILASWYKTRLQNALLNEVYSNKNHTKGIDLKDTAFKAQIYQRYLKAYKQGVFNYVKEDQNPITNEVSPRKYFSGGFVGDMSMLHVSTDTSTGARQLQTSLSSARTLVSIEANMDIARGLPFLSDRAMSTDELIRILKSLLWQYILSKDELGNLRKKDIQIKEEASQISLWQYYPRYALYATINKGDDSHVLLEAFEHSIRQLGRLTDTTEQNLDNLHSLLDAPMLKSTVGIVPTRANFDEQINAIARVNGIRLHPSTKIALFIGGEHIVGGYYYHLFDHVVRQRYGIDLVYLPYPVKAGDEDRIRFVREEIRMNPRIVGAVITRPWKEFFGGGTKIGAVNFIQKTPHGLEEFVTDGPAWIKGLNHDLGHDYNFKGSRIFIIGAGGAARELAQALNGKGIDHITFVDTDRRKIIGIEMLTLDMKTDYKTDFLNSADSPLLTQANIVINATGVGRGDTAGEMPLTNPDLFRKGQIVTDLISDAETEFLRAAQAKGVKVLTGRSMFLFGMVGFIQGWMGQIKHKVPSEQELFSDLEQRLSQRVRAGQEVGENVDVLSPNGRFHVRIEKSAVRFFSYLGTEGSIESSTTWHDTYEGKQTSFRHVLKAFFISNNVLCVLFSTGRSVSEEWGPGDNRHSYEYTEPNVVKIVDLSKARWDIDGSGHGRWIEGQDLASFKFWLEKKNRTEPGRWGFAVKDNYIIAGADVFSIKDMHAITDGDEIKMILAGPPDKASLAMQSKNTRGGIDLNTQNMQWEFRKDGQGVVMDFDSAMMEQFKRQGVATLTPRIFRILPLNRADVWSMMAMSRESGIDEVAR